MTQCRTFLLLNMFCVFFAFTIYTACSAKERRPSRYLIPKGYVGWIRIDFNIKGAPALPIEDDHYIIKIPLNGYLETSTDIEYGVARDDYYYYSEDKLEPLENTGWDGGGMIWATSTGKSSDSTGETTATYERFFVGTEDDYKKYGADYGGHQIGPIEKHSPTGAKKDRGKANR